jgi:hypothetical protein
LVEFGGAGAIGSTVGAAPLGFDILTRPGSRYSSPSQRSTMAVRSPAKGWFASFLRLLRAIIDF